MMLYMFKKSSEFLEGYKAYINGKIMVTKDAIRKYSNSENTSILSKVPKMKSELKLLNKELESLNNNQKINTNSKYWKEYMQKNSSKSRAGGLRKKINKQ